MDRNDFQVPVSLAMRMPYVHHGGLTRLAFNLGNNFVMDHRKKSVLPRNVMPICAGFPPHRHQ